MAVAAPILMALQTRESFAERVERCIRDARAEDTPPPCLYEAAEGISPSVLAVAWNGLEERERRRFRRALAAAMHRDLLGLEVEMEELRHELRSRRVVAELASGRLVDVRWGDTSLKRHYRDLCQPLWTQFSFDYLVGELEDRGVVVLEDFEDHPLDELPRRWKWRGFEQEDDKPYRIAEESGNRFLRAEDRGENVMLYKEVRWDAQKYPFISWRWRIRAVPEGADARYEASADSAAGFYLSYRRKLAIVPETVKFVWSGHLRAGAAFRRPGVGMPWTVVAGSGAADEARWHRVVYDVSDVYRETFGGTFGGRPLGFGVLSDANSTGSFAAADYDDIVLLKEAEAPARIREFLELEN